MRVSISHRERQQPGLFNAKSLYDVSVDVQFSQEELAIIDKYKIHDDIVVERDFSTVVSRTYDVPTIFWLVVAGLAFILSIMLAVASGAPGGMIGLWIIALPYPLYRAWRAYRASGYNRPQEAEYLYVRDLIRNHPDVYTCASPSQAKEYERILIGSLENMKARLQAEGEGIEEKHKVFEL
jgi:hypothetical protein